MISLFILSLLCATLSEVAFGVTKHCECKEHIFCLFPMYSPGLACVNFEKDGFDEKEKKLTLQLINELRNKVAMGKEERGKEGPQPKAADMMEVTWDLYLQSTAQRYAHQCMALVHSSESCRKAENYMFGENLAVGPNVNESMAYLNHIDGWYNAVKDFPPSQVDSFNPNATNHSFDNYAQLINAKTYHVGCGKSRWGMNSSLVCHFGPAVLPDKPLYTRGPPASKCRNGTKSAYEGLCALGSRCSLSRFLMASIFCVKFTLIL